MSNLYCVSADHPPAYSQSDAAAAVPHSVEGQVENHLPHTPDLPPQYDQLSIRTTDSAERGNFSKPDIFMRGFENVVIIPL